MYKTNITRELVGVLLDRNKLKTLKMLIIVRRWAAAILARLKRWLGLAVPVHESCRENFGIAQRAEFFEKRRAKHQSMLPALR